jgi:hypothetical protein
MTQEDMSAGAYEIELAIDLDSIPDATETIPAGKYNAEIASAVPGKSKAGQPKIELRWKIIEPMFETDAKVENRSVLDSISFHPNKMGITKQQLKALGVTGQLNIALGDLAAQLLGIRTGIVVDIEKGVNKDPQTGEVYPDRNRIKKISPKLFTPDGGVDNLLSED